MYINGMFRQAKSRPSVHAADLKIFSVNCPGYYDYGRRVFSMPRHP